MTDDALGITPGSWQSEAWKHFKAMGLVITEELNRGMPEGLKLVWPVAEDVPATQAPQESSAPSTSGTAGSRPRPDGGMDRGVRPEGRWVTEDRSQQRALDLPGQGLVVIVDTVSHTVPMSDIVNETPHKTRTAGQTAVELANSALAIGLAVALVLGVLTVLFVGLARDHKSSALICAEAGGSYQELLRECDVPAAR